MLHRPELSSAGSYTKPDLPARGYRHSTHWWVWDSCLITGHYPHRSGCMSPPRPVCTLKPARGKLIQPGYEVQWKTIKIGTRVTTLPTWLPKIHCASTSKCICDLGPACGSGSLTINPEFCPVYHRRWLGTLLSWGKQNSLTTPLSRSGLLPPSSSISLTISAGTWGENTLLSWVIARVKLL